MMVPFYSVMLHVTMIPAKFDWNCTKFRGRSMKSNVSDRDATYLLAVTAQSLGHDDAVIAINRDSIRRARIARCSQIAGRVQLIFSRWDGPVPLTVHWDGKILSDITRRESVERLPVLVSGYEVDQLLGVPKLNHGTSEETSRAVVSVLKDWGWQIGSKWLVSLARHQTQDVQQAQWPLKREKLHRASQPMCTKSYLVMFLNTHLDHQVVQTLHFLSGSMRKLATHGYI